MADPKQTTAQEIAALMSAFPMPRRHVLMARLRAQGWIICAPDCVPMPRNRREAEAMNLLSERYLKDHPA
jgi:hypothetical protein